MKLLLSLVLAGMVTVPVMAKSDKKAETWEIVPTDTKETITERLVVPGGWLYRVVPHDPTVSPVMDFVPYPANGEEVMIRKNECGDDLLSH